MSRLNEQQNERCKHSGATSSSDIRGRRKVKVSGDFCSLGAMDRTHSPHPLVQTAIKWSIFYHSMNCLSLWCTSPVFITHFSLLLERRLSQRARWAQQWLPGRGGNQLHAVKPGAQGNTPWLYTKPALTLHQPSCPVPQESCHMSSPGKLCSAQTPFPRENRDSATRQLKNPSITEKLIYLVFPNRECLIWINSTDSYHQLNTGQPLLLSLSWVLDYLFHQQY